jgi:PAS domain S-box-containing protein
MAALMRAYDWSQTPLGPVSEWPQSLKTAVSICLNSRFPILLWWGPDLTILYNDAYRPILGKTKHPRALGSPGREIWPEVWEIIGPMLESVLATGQATWSDDQLLVLDRNGYLEEAYFTFSYSSIRDESGHVGGVFTAVNETTLRVIGERRLRTLRDLGALLEASTAEEACRLAMTVLSENEADVPFALLYLLNDDSTQAALVASMGLEAGTPLSPLCMGLEGGETPEGQWPLAEVLRSGKLLSLHAMRAQFGKLPSGPWTDSPNEALVLPIMAAGRERPAAILVAGVSSARLLDEEYRSFFNLVASHIGAAVTKARAYEEERRRAEALAELDRAKTTFFSNVSHEFRTPLTLMLGPIEDALASESRALQGESLETVHRNSLRLLKLVNTLLDFSRIEAGRIQARYEPTDLATYTAELASVFRSAVEKAGMRLIIDCSPLPEPVFIDQDMWEKIVLNLLSNAFKFTLEGEIRVRLRERNGQAVLTVQDTGAGISAEQLPHIFERFHRVEGLRARTHEGTGIGLALVQELVKLHGGAIAVESAVGAGTTFTLTIPLGKAHLSPERISAPVTLASTSLGAEAFVEEALRWLPEESQAVVASPYTTAEVASLSGQSRTEEAGRARILMADDNADMREYVRRLLHPHYDILAVANGKEALRSVQAARPDLVISDVMMPELDGFGLLHTLRNNPYTASIPFILLSARAGEEARIEGLSAGADDYLIKPFSARELLARVSAHLELARVRREAEEAIRQSEAQLQTLLASAPLGIYLVDSDFRIRAINPTARAAFGDIPGLIGRDFDEVIHILWDKEYADEIVRRYRHTLETGEPYNTPEWIEERRDRGIIEYYEWQVHRIPLPEGGYGVVCYFRDIAAQVLAKEAIAESEEQSRRTAEGLRAIAARAHCLLWYAEVEDRGERNLHWTLRVADEEAARRFLPVVIPFGHSYGRALAEARLPEDRVRMAWGDEQIRAGRSYQQEFRVRDASGNIRWLAEDVQIETLGPNRWYAVGVCVDITERKRAEEERERHLAEIETLNRRLQRAMTETHHRVKNNLQLISALIDMQRAASGEMVPVSEFARLSSNVRALSVIHDLLTQEAKEGSDQERLSARDVLENLVGVLKQTMGDRPLALESDDVRLVGRQATALALVTNELVSNALKHGKGAIEIYFRADSARAILEICDDGPGFPAGFDPLMASHTGLELVENVVQWDLRGTTAYASRPQGGAQITVTFPIATG